MDREYLGPEPLKEELAKVKDNYLKLKAEVQAWQQELGEIVAKEVQVAQTPPYFTLDKLPEERVVELWYRLNQVAGELLAVQDLKILMQKYKQGEQLEDSLVARLHLALAGVAEAVSRKIAPQQEVDQEKESNQPYGPCPVCGEKSFVTFLTPPVGKRYQKCLICSHQRPVKASGCACCGSEDAKKQTYLQAEEYPGIEIAVCSDCGSYFKQIDLRKIMVKDFVWEDLKTLSLNYAAENWLAGQKGWH